ncbi:MAG: histidine kinase N-terminal 7TM domain-containing protein [Desulfobacterales bacterium]|jgi:hypothetical protein
MAGINPYALPNIIAFVLLLVLSLAVIFQNQRDKSNRLLFALCLNLALSVGAGGMLHLSTSEAQANFWNKWPYIFGIPSYIWAIEYALQISGRSQRLKEKLIGIPIALHRWIIYGFIPIWLSILLSSDLILAPAKFYSPTGWEHGYGPLFPVVPIYGMYLLLFHCFILYRGIKTASNSIEKKARIVTFTALIGRDVFGFFIGVIFPFCHMPDRCQRTRRRGGPAFGFGHECVTVPILTEYGLQRSRTGIGIVECGLPGRRE